jgi:hypothetical protein
MKQVRLGRCPKPRQGHLWKPNRLRPPSDADRNADRRLRYLFVQRTRRPGRVRQRALRERGRRRQESQNGSERISEAPPIDQPA